MLSKTKPQSGLRRTLIGYALVLVVGIAGLIAVQGFVVKPFLVPSSSMAATILPGQRILVDRMVYHFRAVHRGDIIVFRGPAPRNECSSSAPWGCLAICSPCMAGGSTSTA